jgi:hypothetical protein
MPALIVPELFLQLILSVASCLSESLSACPSLPSFPPLHPQKLGAMLDATAAKLPPTYLYSRNAASSFPLQDIWLHPGAQPGAAAAAGGYARISVNPLLLGEDGATSDIAVRTE